MRNGAIIIVTTALPMAEPMFLNILPTRPSKAASERISSGITAQRTGTAQIMAGVQVFRQGAD